MKENLAKIEKRIMHINHLHNYLEFRLEEVFPDEIREIIEDCIKKAGYSLKDALTNDDIVNEIRMTIYSSLHKLNLNADKCIKAQIKLWSGYYTLSRYEKDKRDEKDREYTPEEMAEYDAIAKLLASQ
jgi:hypothetical protein